MTTRKPVNLTASVPADVLELLNRLRAHGYEAWAVGGCVRDLLMGVPPHDWDLCTSALPEETERCFADDKVVETGLRHGTVTVVRGGQAYEITTYRTEGNYSDHRHPDGVSFVRSLREDLARRDFTINAMAYHPEEGLVDCFGGEEDLRRGVLRCVGEPERRFREDALRILRLLRFAARLGFTVDPETAQAALSLRGELDYVARERVFSELKGLLVGRHVRPVLEQYRELAAQCIPELRPMFDHPQDNPHHCYDVWIHTTHAVEAAPPDAVLRLTMLLHDCGKPDCFTHDANGVGHFHGHAERSAELADTALTRLRCDNETKAEILCLIRWHDRLHVVNRTTVRRALLRLGEPRFRRLLAVIRADNQAKGPRMEEETRAQLDEAERLLEELLQEQLCLSLKNLAVNGRDALALGASGPTVGRVLNTLLSEVQEEVLPNERDALLKRMSELLKNQ